MGALLVVVAAGAPMDRRASLKALARGYGGRRTESTRPSQPLEAAEALPVGDGRLERLELDMGVVEVVRDDLVAEGVADDVARAEELGRLAQRRWDARLVRQVGVALERRLERELAVDAVQAAGDERGDREIRVDVGAREPALDPPARPVADDAQR